MIAWVVGLISGLISALLLRSLLTAGSSLLARDDPNQRSLHREQTPRGGGLAIFISVTVVIILGGWSLEAESWLIGVVLCVLGFALVGFVDDHRSLPVGIRMILGLSLASAMGIAGIATEHWILFDKLFLLLGGVSFALLLFILFRLGLGALEAYFVGFFAHYEASSWILCVC